MPQPINIIITGATGMVGEGVLHECLHHEGVGNVLIINRRPSGYTHPKLTEIIHADFFDITPIADRLAGYDGCCFCLGVSSLGMQEPEFYKMTYTLTMHVAEVLSQKNPGTMTFCYVSGAGTDSTEQGRLMWARVKGKTENDLAKLPFKKTYNFRPGYMHPTPGLKFTLPYYKYFTWLYPVLRLLFPGSVSTLKEMGLAMINAVLLGYEKREIEVKDIKILAKRTA